MQSHPTPHNKANVSAFTLELSRLYVAKLEQYINSICVDILQHTGDNQAKKTWDAVNLLTNRRARTTGLIPAQDDDDHLQRRYKHFSKLLSPYEAGQIRPSTPQGVASDDDEEMRDLLEEEQSLAQRSKVLRRYVPSQPVAKQHVVEESNVAICAWLGVKNYRGSQTARFSVVASVQRQPKA